MCGEGAVERLNVMLEQIKDLEKRMAAIRSPGRGIAAVGLYSNHHRQNHRRPKSARKASIAREMAQVISKGSLLEGGCGGERAGLHRRDRAGRDDRDCAR